jgi:V/A-type H+-transporting ATPase subunit E
MSMATNIESFVETLRSEGVDAGKKAAAEIEAQARQEADLILAEAEKKAKAKLAAAQAEAEQIQTRMLSSLELATRDGMLALREKLGQLLTALIHQQSEKQLSDEETLAAVMRDVIPAYSKAESQGSSTAEIHVPKDLHNRLVTGAIRELTRALKNQDIQVEVKASLAKAGFEYKIKGSTVEVTPESVTALLSEMIDPELRTILDQAVGS